ncbi:MAG: DNA primase [Acidimicrobiales bacterium]
MALAEDEIARVRAATDIVALITESVALKRSGQRWVGLCPFHGERTPSFSVNAHEGRYYCFGCRAAGDQITWVRETQHLDFVEAVRHLAERAGIELREDAYAGPARKERQVALEAMARAVDWYHERLLSGPDARPARDYLRARGISGEVARTFRLGWAPDEWDALTRALSLDAKVLEATGLGFTNRRGRLQDFVRGRVIFPIFDPSGKPVALGGRILPGAGERNDGRVEPKYKNSPETAIYSKRKTLYGLHLAKDDVVRTGEIVVCEGYTDVIAFFLAGVPRAVATCGTALGEDHFRVMRNFARRIVLAYDADGAGQSAAASVYQWERQHEVDVVVARLPDGLDPAELAQRDPAALGRAVEGAVPFLRFRLERVLEGADTTSVEGRARAGELCAAVIAEHPSELTRDQYVMDVADRLRLEPRALREAVAAHRRGDRPAEGPTRRAAPAPRARTRPRPGHEALRFAVHGPRELRERLAPALFSDEVQRSAFEALLEASSTQGAIEALERRGEEEAALELAEIAVEAPEESLTEGEVAAVVAQLIRSALPEALASLSRELSAGRIDPEVVRATIVDVKAREERLREEHGAGAVEAERDLREWLIARAATAP